MIEQKVWHVAVKNTTTSKDKWFYHLFYDFDNIELSDLDKRYLVDFMRKHEQSFILRRTNHGYHLIGLTPNHAMKWGIMFDTLQRAFPTYHDGQAIRITSKSTMNDEFIVIAENYDFNYSLHLRALFTNQKTITDLRAIRELWYVLLYYTTNKKNRKNKEIIDRNG